MGALRGSVLLKCSMVTYISEHEKETKERQDKKRANEGRRETRLDVWWQAVLGWGWVVPDHGF